MLLKCVRDHNSNNCTHSGHVCCCTHVVNNYYDKFRSFSSLYMTLFRHRTCTYLHGRADRFLVSVSNGQVAALSDWAYYQKALVRSICIYGFCLWYYFFSLSIHVQLRFLARFNLRKKRWRRCSITWPARRTRCGFCWRKVRCLRATRFIMPYVYCWKKWHIKPDILACFYNISTGGKYFGRLSF